MHDLNQIIDNNAKAHSQSIDYYLNRGQDVVAEYDGLTLLNVKPFDDRNEAEVYLAEPLDSVSKYRRIQHRRVDPVGNRDQSEDRKPTTIVVDPTASKE